MSLLKIDNLSTEVDGKGILNKLNLKIEKGETHVLVGPNASGKSTLLYTLMGYPEYNVTEGKLLFNDEDITDMEIEERTKRGIAGVYQNPPAINVKLSTLLDKISEGKKQFKSIEGLEGLLDRDVNVGYSGGERKLSEVAQVISLDPDFIILDELDAGLDIENLERISQVVKEELSDKTLLIITHRGRALKFFEPDYAHVMMNGEIICSSKDSQKIWKTIEEDGYERCKEC